MGTHMIVLDSPEAVFELMERRSSIYSDRARMPMINELMHWSFNIGFMPYGNSWRKGRRLFHQFFSSTAAQRFHPDELKATHHLLERLLDDTSDLYGSLRYLSGETIMSVAYGLDVKQKDDPYIELAERGTHPLSLAAIPGKFLVDMIPMLKYVPEWMPGAGFQKKAREWRKLTLAMVNMPFEATKHLIAEGKARSSFTSQCIQRALGTGDDAYSETDIRYCAGSMYAAASDTTAVVISSCILAMLENPEVLKKAQDQLDSVIKPGYLPDFDDEKHLPYITAVTLETLRWENVAPIAIPRYLQVDDEYKGYRIPKGSIVIPNAWALLHNEEAYPDSFTFKPERFLTKDGKIDKTVKDPRHACFGFGRRVCPGRHMAFSSVWIAIASILYCFDIKKAVDETGNVIEPNHEYISGMVIIPKPFECSIKPRSDRHERSIRSAVLQNEFSETA